MGILKKLKDVLFDLEEDLPVITKNDDKSEKTVKPPKYKEENTIKEIKIPKEEFDDKLDLIDNNFNFPLDLDEQLTPRRGKAEYNSNLNFDEDYPSIFSEEQPSNRNNQNRRGRDFIRDGFETKVKAGSPFKPTPIISPVYGVLDQNYSKDDIIVKTDIGVKGPDLDEVRKKAYGIEIKKSKNTKFEENISKEEFDDSLKTLDEILMSEEKETKNIDNTKVNLPKVKEVINDNFIEDDNFEIFNEEEEKQDIEDTIESDLFNLIDSMYEDKEEREDV